MRCGRMALVGGWMSYVVASPEAFAAASQDLTSIGSAVRAAAAAGPTTQVVAAAQDEVSTAIAGVFGNYTQQYQTLIAQAGQFHDQFVQALTTSAGAYAATEAANAEISRSAITPGPLVQFKENLGEVEAGIAAVAQQEETDFEAVLNRVRSIVSANLAFLLPHINLVR